MITKINERGVKAYCDFLATFSLACIMYTLPAPATSHENHVLHTN